MTQREQCSHFGDDLDRLVDRYRDEYDMTMASVVGVLHMKAWLLCEEAGESNDDGGETETA